MAKNKEIQNVAIVGTGVIGASWAAYYVARGFNVIARDPAPNWPGGTSRIAKFVSLQAAYSA